MRKTLTFAAMAVMIALAWNADGAAVQQKSPAKKTTAKKTAAKTAAAKTTATKKSATSKTSTAARKSGTTSGRTTAARSRKSGPRGVTWRNRQTVPTPDRYREIQSALAEKGFLKPEDATGTWNQNSADAMKRFQADQNLESSGKINSLSLIALGLGPHRDPAPPAKPPQIPPGQ